jgi:hypothetical protein
MFSILSVPRLYNENVFAVEYRLGQSNTEAADYTAEIERENLVEFWRIGSLKWLKKEWQEDCIVIWSDSS